ncbi:MAG: type III PLP-dependent enzyme [Chloroflexota bacterium]|nr:type III PLP-dependent enzyme [Chloroflexota bacterium]
MSLAPDARPPSIEVGRTVAGLDADELVARFGSPLYVYDAELLRGRVAALRAALPDVVDIAFATKANPSPLVLSTLSEAGLGSDVASGGELRAVLRAGFAPERIVFTGPGKTDAELEAALRGGVGALTIESLDELDAVIERARMASPGQGLALRLATGGDAEDRPIIGAAGSAKFGLTDEEADEAISRLLGVGALAPEGPFALRGFHAFGASNILGADVLVAGVSHLAVRAQRIAARHGLELELLDAGGGLGVPYGGEPPLDLAALGEGIRAELATWVGRAPLRNARLLFEPGRWLTAPAGIYLCRVTRTKLRSGRHIAITDGGIHHLLRPRLVGQDHRVVPVGAAAARATDAQVDVVGPLCTGIDILAASVSAPRPRAGDLFAVLDAGAYGYSESMPLFLSHPIPAEIVIDGGHTRVSRERVEPE